MSRRFYTGSVAALTLLGLIGATSAQAQVVFSLGNTPGGDNVLFNNDPPAGTTVEGELNQNSINYTVLYESTGGELLLANGGQALIEGNGDGIINNAFSLRLAGAFGFTQIVANPNDVMGVGGTLMLGVDFINLANSATGSTGFSYEIGNGENFFTLLADPNFLITKVTFSGTPLDDLRQTRINGAASTRTPPTGNPIPEPGTYALMATGILPLAGLLRRRRAA